MNSLLRRGPSVAFSTGAEEFGGELTRYWRSDGASKEWPDLLKVEEFGQVRGQRKYPGIQAAGLLAWYRNRNVATTDYGVELAVLTGRTITARPKLFGEDELIATYINRK